MTTLYAPQKPTSFRVHKTIPKGKRILAVNEGRVLRGGGVFAAEYGSLRWRCLEASRRSLTRLLRRAKVWVRVRLTQPLTAKAKQARMGKGKGKLRGWAGFTRPGTLLYEMDTPSRRTVATHPSTTTRHSGHFPFERVGHKLSFRIRVRRVAHRFYRSTLRVAPGLRLGYQRTIPPTSRRVQRYDLCFFRERRRAFRLFSRPRGTPKELFSPVTFLELL